MFAISDLSNGGCGLVRSQAVRATSGYVWSGQEACPDQIQRVRELAESTSIDVVLVHNSWDAAALRVDNAWIEPDEPEHAALVMESLNTLVDSVRQSSPTAVIVLVTDRETNGILTQPGALARHNALLEKRADEDAGVVVLDWNTLLEQVSEVTPAIFQEDNVHLSAAGRAALVDLLPAALGQAIANGREELEGL